MEIKTLEPLLAAHPFFGGLAPAHRELIASCARNVQFGEGEYIAREGEPADQFFVVRSGRIAIAIQAPQRGALTIQTLDDDDVLGFSSLFPPYSWNFDVRVVEPARVLAFDAKCLRSKFDADAALGYALTSRFATVMLERLRATQLQLLDLYGAHDD